MTEVVRVKVEGQDAEDSLSVAGTNPRPISFRRELSKRVAVPSEDSFSRSVSFGRRSSGKVIGRAPTAMDQVDTLIESRRAVFSRCAG